MYDWAIFLILAFSSLFTIVNPFSTASIFLVITKGETKKRRIAMSKKAVITAFFVLLTFAIGGNYILRFFGITIDAFLIAGGIVISGIGIGMINAKPDHLTTEDEKKEAIDKDDISVVPLAIPLLSGPGAITTSIVLMGNASNPFESALVLFSILMVCIVTFVILSKADIIEKRMGEMGRKIIGRIMGIIVLVIGVQFIINGTVSVIRTLILNI